MATVKFQGNDVRTAGDLPSIGDKAPSFNLTKSDLSTITLDDFKGKPVIFNIFPSIDTGVCFESAKKFNEIAKQENIAVLCVSMDLPFAQNRVAEKEGLNNITLASDFKDHQFGKDYNLLLLDGPLQGVLARAVIMLDENHVVNYTQLVNEITTGPNYEDVLQAL